MQLCSMPHSHHPHDEFFKAAFSRKEIAIDYLQQFLPERVIKRLNLQELSLVNNSFTTGKLRQLYSDIVYTCPYGAGKQQVLLTFLLEHKSYPEKHPHFQLLRYMLEIWEVQLRQKQALTPVLPVIFYHGEKSWKKLPLRSYFKNLDEELKPYLPEFQYHLTDLDHLKDEEILQLKARFLVNVLLIMK
ncbi:MAG TPA: Rpn family recombination-promoting nuclease/putative transposase, partial [Saprospiraceae bacterium]|nr:Rpn family recombination-promoting nuclease/putative transposase [Saprospiraceae bacterium]